MKRLFRKQRTASYDPFTYWNSRANPNNIEGTDAARVAFDSGYIASAVSDLDPVLELGPGVGRTLGAYARGRNITALDLSRAYTDQLLLRGSELGLKLTPLYLSSPMDPFPLADKSFPVGVASQVLMHIPPESVTHSLSELVRVCERVVVISTYQHGAPTISDAVTHVFNHDYFSMATDLGCAMHEVT